MLMIGIYIFARRTGLPRQPRAPFGEIWGSFRDAVWGLLLVVVIMAGIYGGVFTPTEAAAVAAVYAFFVALFVYRDMGPLKNRRRGAGDDVPFLQSVGKGVVESIVYFPIALVHEDTRKVFMDAGKMTIMLMFIIANAMLFAHVLTTERIPHAITEAILSAGFSPWMFLIVVNIILLIAGNFMEPSAILLIMAPILFPIAIRLGIDPIHLGIIMVVNMEIGLITPPVGLNLFVTSGITGMSLLEVVRAALPWLGILLIFLILVTYVPWLSTFLPNLLFGPQT